MNLETVLGSARAQTLTPAIIACAREAYAENAARFSDELGDNNMTFATCVIHNLRHLLAEALGDEPGIRIERPDGSFQLIAGRAIFHFYKGRLGPADAIEIRFDSSQTKRRLVQHNADQLQLQFEEDEIDETALAFGPTHLVFVHAGDHIDGLRTLWVGAPVLSGLNGFRWLWSEQVYGEQSVAVRSDTHANDTEPWIDESDLPDLIIGLREQPTEEEDASGSR